MVSPALSLRLPIWTLDANQDLVRWLEVEVDPFVQISPSNNLRNGLHTFRATAAPPIAVGLQPLRLEVRNPANCLVGAHGSRPQLPHSLFRSHIHGTQISRHPADRADKSRWAEEFAMWSNDLSSDSVRLVYKSSNVASSLRPRRDTLLSRYSSFFSLGSKCL